MHSPCSRRVDLNSYDLIVEAGRMVSHAALDHLLRGCSRIEYQRKEASIAFLPGIAEAGHLHSRFLCGR